MTIAQISNGESGSSVRSKLNALIDAVNALGTAPAPTPTLNLTGGTATAEGNSGTTNVPITATAARNGVTGAITGTWAITGIGSSPAGSGDFAAMTGTFTIPSGQNSVQFNIAIVGETTVEPNETYRVTGTLDAPYASVSGSTDGSITNDDSAAIYASPSGAVNVMFVGDSIIEAPTTTGGSAADRMGLASKAVVNKIFAKSGTGLSQLSATPPATGGVSDQMERYFNPGRVNVAIIQRSTNDYGGNTVDQMMAFLATAIALYKSQGYYVLVATTLFAGGFEDSAPLEAKRQDFNTRVRALSTIDGVIDVAAVTSMNTSSAINDTAKYSDRLHPTAAGQDVLAATYAAAIAPFMDAAKAIRFPASTPARPPLYVTAAATYGAVKFGNGAIAGQFLAPFPAAMTPLFPSTYEITTKTTANGAEFMRQQSPTGKAAWTLLTFNNNILCVLYDAAGGGTFVYGPGYSNDGLPHRVAIEFTSSATTVYVDGVAGTAGPALDRGGVSVPVQLIADSVGLDEFAVFGSAHGAASNISSAYAGTEANLLALYHLADATDGRP